jgi:hypothetical protein
MSYTGSLTNRNGCHMYDSRACHNRSRAENIVMTSARSTENPHPSRVKELSNYSKGHPMQTVQVSCWLVTAISPLTLPRKPMRTFHESYIDISGTRIHFISSSWIVKINRLMFNSIRGLIETQTRTNWIRPSSTLRFICWRQGPYNRANDVPYLPTSGDLVYDKSSPLFIWDHVGASQFDGLSIDTRRTRCLQDFGFDYLYSSVGTLRVYGVRCFNSSTRFVNMSCVSPAFSAQFLKYIHMYMILYFLRDI